MISSQECDIQANKNILEARMDNARDMATLLKAVHFKEVSIFVTLFNIKLVFTCDLNN